MSKVIRLNDETMNDLEIARKIIEKKNGSQWNFLSDSQLIKYFIKLFVEKNVNDKDNEK